MKLKWLTCLSSLLLLVANCSLELRAADKKKQLLGIFEQAVDIGDDLVRGTSSYDRAKKQYTVAGGGVDMWENSDDFHFLWRRVSGNWISITCTLALPPEGDDPYPKAGLMFRQSLEDDAPYVDALLHANGMIALQYRRRKGEPTGQIISEFRGDRLMLERKKHWMVIWVGTPDGGFVECGSVDFDFPQSFYAGLAVCAHNRDRLLTVRFSDVTLETDAGHHGP